jgi:hypothetical protein
MLGAMRIGFEPRRPGVGVAAAVAALHLAVALALLGARAWPDRQAATPAQAIEIWLITAPASSDQAQRKPEREPTGRTSASKTVVHGAAQAITLPPAVASESKPPAVAEPVGSAESPAAPALILDLPRTASAPQRWRNPALDDPRTNTPRRTLEAMIAGTMRGDDRLVEEPLGAGRIRYRRGSECALVTPARGAAIDPFNQSTSPTPRLVEPC